MLAFRLREKQRSLDTLDLCLNENELYARHTMKKYHASRRNLASTYLDLEAPPLIHVESIVTCSLIYCAQNAHSHLVFNSHHTISTPQVGSLNNHLEIVLIRLIARTLRL